MRVDPDFGALLREALQLGEQVEVNAVRAEEDVAGQGVQCGEGVLEIASDAGVGRWLAGAVDEVVLGPEGIAAEDHDIAQLRGWVAGEMYAEGPCGAAAGVAGGLVGGEGEAAKRDRVVVVQDAVDVGGREGFERVAGGEEVGLAAGLHHGDVAVHDFVLRVSFADDFGRAGAVVEVGLRVEQDLGVVVLEAKLLNAGADLWRRGREVGVDEDIALGCSDQVAGQIAAADVVKIVGDLEGREWRGPVGVGVCVGRADEGRETSEDEKEAERAHLC